MQERPVVETSAEQAQEAVQVLPKKVLERSKLEAKLEALKAEAAAAPAEQAEARKKNAELQEKRIRLHESMHDNTGVLKGDYFGSRLAERFEAYEFPKTQDGSYEVPPEFENGHLFLVNMGELDRLNAGGDHTTGDRGLEMTAGHVENVIQQALLEGDPTLKDDPERLAKSYELYRAAGNDFAFRLDGVDAALAEEIRRRLSAPLDVSKRIPGEEPVPLSASRVSLAEAIRVLNGLPSEDRTLFENDPKRETVAVTAAKEMLQQMNDKEKLETRVARMLKKMKEGDAAAKDFYEKFQAKALSPVFGEDPQAPLSYEEFKSRLASMGGLDGKPEWSARLAELARTEAKRQFEGRRGSQQRIDRAVSDIAAQTFLEYRPAPLEERMNETRPESAGFAPPENTRGTELVGELQKRAQEAESALQNKACEEHSIDPACQNREEHRLNLEIETANRDTLTGLEQRGRMFDSLEKSLENGEPVSTVFIDMAFLKYFDKEGGRETGNMAIRTAAKLLDEISKELSNESAQVGAYRIGGDEFALTVRGSDGQKLQEVLTALRRKQMESPDLPLQDASALGSYFDQGLSFNYGVHHAENAASLKAFLKENGLPLEQEGTPKEQNELAEYMLRFADKQLEIQKGVNRLALLLKERESAGGKEEGKYGQLLKYSQKAIFGEAGTQRIEEWHARLSSAQTSEERLQAERAIDAEMLEFTLEKIREKHAQNEKYQESLDKVIEDRVRDLFLEQKVASLEADIAGLRQALALAAAESADLRAQNQDLKKKIELLEGEKQHIDALRAKLSG